MFIPGMSKQRQIYHRIKALLYINLSEYYACSDPYFFASIEGYKYEDDKSRSH